MGKGGKIIVGITQGDTNGVGYEVILKALEDNRILELCTPIIYGSAKIAAFYRKAAGLAPVQLNQINTASEAKADSVNIINVVREDVKIEPGESTAIAGQAAYAALDRAARDLSAGEIDVLVTAPINKHSIQSDDFSFAGHTEWLESRFGDGAKSLMILFNDIVRVALVTTHTPISKIAEEITGEKILEKIEILNESLINDFGIHKPRIAVLGLNPHAGDDGLLGTEERDIIAPAIEEARQRKILAFGPYAADGFFGSGNFKRFDGVLAMYHDQGLAPFKTIAMDSGVNFTAGLPIVRTSPDHGTGYDIAGQGKASAASMREAIYAAIDIYRNRERHGEATRNPLRKLYVAKGKDNVVLDLTKDSE